MDLSKSAPSVPKKSFKEEEKSYNNVGDIRKMIPENLYKSNITTRKGAATKQTKLGFITEEDEDQRQINEALE